MMIKLIAPGPQDVNTTWLIVTEWCVVFIFSVECLIKLLAENRARTHHFLHDPWNGALANRHLIILCHTTVLVATHSLAAGGGRDSAA